MAIAETVGKDRRGNPIYLHDDDGAEILFQKERKYIAKGELRNQVEKVRELDDDLPTIAIKYLNSLNN